MSSDLASLMLVGREFHRRGPATWNALSAVSVRVLGMERSVLLCDERVPYVGLGNEMRLLR